MTHDPEKFRPGRGLCAVLIERTPRSARIISPAQYHATKADADPSLGVGEAIAGMDVPRTAQEGYMDAHPEHRQVGIGTVLALGRPKRVLKTTVEVTVQHADGHWEKRRRGHHGLGWAYREELPEFAVGDAVLFRQGDAPLGHTVGRTYKLAEMYGYPPGRQVTLMPQAAVLAVLPEGVPGAGVIG